MGKKVEFVQATITDVPATGGLPALYRLVAVDRAGRLWEHTGEMQPGEWKLVTPPDEPDPANE